MDSQLPGQERLLPIIIVDDNEDLISIYIEGLQEFGIPARGFLSADLALREVPDWSKVRAIISDLRMPGTDGLSFSLIARKRGFTGPFVLISGHLDAKNIPFYKSQGISEVLIKPFELINLIKLSKTLAGM